MTTEIEIENKKFNVHLYSILDEFLKNKESPEVIVDFLKSHECYINEIFSCSLYSELIYQIDFFYKCNIEQQKWLFNLMFSLNENLMLYWQMCQAKTKKANEFKYVFKYMQDILKRINCSHPYAGRHSQYVEELDKKCLELANVDKISLLPYYANQRNLEQTFSKLDYSLFKNRIIQLDFFQNLDNRAKWIFLDCMFSNKLLITDKQKIKFFMQLIESEQPFNVKLRAYELMTNDDYFYFNIKSFSSYFNELVEFNKMTDECSSFDEFYMKAVLNNVQFIPAITTMMLLKFPNWLNEWSKIDKDEFQLSLNINDFVERLNHERRQFHRRKH